MAPQQQQQVAALLRQCYRQALNGTRSSAVATGGASSGSTQGSSALLGACFRHLGTAAEASIASTSGRVAASAAAAAGSQQALGAAAAPRGLKGLIHNYKQLSKFKLSSLVVLTASAGFVAGSGESIDYAQLAWTSLGTFGAAACANTLNQLYEVANDARMSRTRNRPLPAGRMGRMHAAAFAATMGAAGLWVLYDKVSRSAHQGKRQAACVPMHERCSHGNISRPTRRPARMRPTQTAMRNPATRTFVCLRFRIAPPPPTASHACTSQRQWVYAIIPKGGM